MIGVVVWSNKGREQAVIWCDDHAALAYLVGRDHFSADHGWPEPGDMVELGDEVQGELRYARSVRPLTDSPAVRLTQMLKKADPLAGHRGQPTNTARETITAEILPLKRRVG